MPKFRWLNVSDSLATLRDEPSKSVDLVCTDPPYSSGGLHANARRQGTDTKYQRNDAKKHHNFEGDHRDQRSWGYWCTLWLSECRRITRPGGLLLCFADWRQYPMLSDCVQAADWIWRGTVVWNKGPSARAPSTGFARHQAEYLCFASRGKVNLADGRGPFAGVLNHSSDRVAKRKHQTAKPIPLMRDLMLYCPPGGVVLDPFGGSASTGVAAIEAGLSFIGYEREKHYFDVGQARLTETAERHTATKTKQPTLFADQE